MTKDEAKAKFNRVAEDKSQLQQFVYQLLDGEVPVPGAGTDVEANPELSGDEAALTSLEVNGVKYKIEGGGSTTSGVDVLELSGPILGGTHTCTAVFTTFAGELEAHKDILNQGIQQINTDAHLNIPLMTDLASLSDIIAYLNANVNDSVYNEAMTGFFGWINPYILNSVAHLTLSEAQGTVPIMLEITSNPNAYKLYEVGIDSYSVNLEGSASGPVTGQADGQDSMGGDVSLAVTADADLTCSVYGEVTGAGEFVLFASNLNSKYTSLVVKQGGGGDTPSVTGSGLYKHSMSFHYNDETDINMDITIELVNNKSDVYTDLTAMISDYQTRPCVSKRIIFAEGGIEVGSQYFSNVYIDTENGTTYFLFLSSDGSDAQAQQLPIQAQYITTTPTDTVEVYSTGGSGGGGSNEVEITTSLVEVQLAQANDPTMIDYHAYFVIADNVLDEGIEYANQQLSQYGITLTRDNWSTTIDTLLSTNPGKLAFNALAQKLLESAINAYGTDYDGHTTNIFIGSAGDWAVGEDGSSLLAISSSLSAGYTIKGSGSDGDTPQPSSSKDYYTFPTLTITDSSDNYIVLKCKQWDANATGFYSDLNDALQDIANNFGATISTVTDMASANTAFATLVPYLNYAGGQIIFQLLCETIKGYATSHMDLRFGQIDNNDSVITELFATSVGNGSYYIDGDICGPEDTDLCDNILNNSGSLVSIVLS